MALSMFGFSNTRRGVACPAPIWSAKPATMGQRRMKICDEGHVFSGKVKYWGNPAFAT